jgi:hypothetical protein
VGLLEILAGVGEFLWALFEGAQWVMVFLDGCGAVLDLFAWKKSGGNRAIRKAAKQAGVSVPRRSGWTWVFTLLTPVVVILTLVLLVHRWGR